MKKCCDGYSFGVTIGTIYILGSIIYFILTSIMYVQYDRVKDPERSKSLKSEGN